MSSGLMAIACLIANLHAAVFYVFFILMMPYFGEYIVILIRDSYFMHRFKIFMLKRKIRTLTKCEKSQEKLEATQAKLILSEEKLIKFKENAKKREENPYKVKLVRRTTVKWLFLIAIFCFAMGLLTPIGDEPYTHIFKLLSGNTTRKYFRTSTISTFRSYRCYYCTYYNICFLDFYRYEDFPKRWFYARRIDNPYIFSKKAILFASNYWSYISYKAYLRFY